MSSLATNPNYTMVMLGLASDQQVRKAAIDNKLEQRSLQIAEIHELQSDMRTGIYDKILLTYLDQRRLEEHDLGETTIDELLDTTQKQIQAVFEHVDSLLQREDLPADHLVSIMKECTLDCIAKMRRKMCEGNPEITVSIVERVVPIPDISSMLLPLASHLREIRLKALPKSTLDFAEEYPDDGFYENR